MGLLGRVTLGKALEVAQLLLRVLGRTPGLLYGILRRGPPSARGLLRQNLPRRFKGRQDLPQRIRGMREEVRTSDQDLPPRIKGKQEEVRRELPERQGFKGRQEEVSLARARVLQSLTSLPPCRP